MRKLATTLTFGLGLAIVGGTGAADAAEGGHLKELSWPTTACSGPSTGPPCSGASKSTRTSARAVTA
jgi:hypothetical protein